VLHHQTVDPDEEPPEQQDYAADDPDPQPDPPAPGSFQGRVRHVSGRGSDSTRGLPPVHQITLSQDDGSELKFGPIPRDGAVEVRVHALGVPEALIFDVCPICGSADEPTREHVPQRDLGGTVMTRTCKRCNSNLGGRVEVELKHWFDDALTKVSVSGASVPGRRKVPRILMRQTEDGKPGMILDTGRVNADIGAMLERGAIELNYRGPIARLWAVAALKHAYLGACLALGEIPNTTHAQQVRADLVAARDWKPPARFPTSRIAGGLRVAKSGRPAQGPTVVLAALVDDDDVVRDWGLSFAGTLFVSWPLDAELFWVAVRRFGEPPALVTD
jgi:hypothetical protein